jgi:hypothetical protein
MYDCTNIGSPVVLIFPGGAGGIASALQPEQPQLYGSEARE